jgi:hypothetical protein
MSTNATPQKAAATPNQGRLPPEEKFWVRYSPHQEMPLSAITSFALHVLTIGGLILLAWLGWLGFSKSTGSVPVEVVRFQPGGGGGKRDGVGDGPGIGTGVEAVETTRTSDDPKQQPTPPDPSRPTLDANALALLPETVRKDTDFIRYVQNGNPNLNVFSSLEKSALNKLRDGLQPGKGEGGTGKGGGKGTGTGPGEGAGTGPGGGGTLTQREKRMLRWTMVFNTRSGTDYLHQLRSLGAILAIPSGPDNKSYKIIRDLSGRAAPKLLDEDISKIQCIFWIDDRPESVRSLMGALHLNMVPSHFVAFMLRELEERLFQMEKIAAGGASEDRIQETKFDVVRTARGYEPKVAGVRVQ